MVPPGGQWRHVLFGPRTGKALNRLSPLIQLARGGVNDRVSQEFPGLRQRAGDDLSAETCGLERRVAESLGERGKEQGVGRFEQTCHRGIVEIVEFDHVAAARQGIEPPEDGVVPPPATARDDQHGRAGKGGGLLPEIEEESVVLSRFYRAEGDEEGPAGGNRSGHGAGGGYGDPRARDDRGGP